MAHDRRRGFRTDHRTIDGPRADTDGLQVLQELCVNLQRKVARPGRLSPEEIRDIVADYLTCHVVVNDGRVGGQSVQGFHERYILSLLGLQSAMTSNDAALGPTTNVRLR
jgi:hypothetical protein